MWQDPCSASCFSSCKTCNHTFWPHPVVEWWDFPALLKCWHTRLITQTAFGKEIDKTKLSWKIELQKITSTGTSLCWHLSDMILCWSFSLLPSLAPSWESKLSSCLLLLLEKRQQKGLRFWSKDTWSSLCWIESGISNTDFAIDQLRNSKKINFRSDGDKKEGNNGRVWKIT